MGAAARARLRPPGQPRPPPGPAVPSVPMQPPVADPSRGRARCTVPDPAAVDRIALDPRGTRREPTPDRALDATDPPVTDRGEQG